MVPLQNCAWSLLKSFYLTLSICLYCPDYVCPANTLENMTCGVSESLITSTCHCTNHSSSTATYRSEPQFKNVWQVHVPHAHCLRLSTFYWGRLHSQATVEQEVMGIWHWAIMCNNTPSMQKYNSIPHCWFTRRKRDEPALIHPSPPSWQMLWCLSNRFQFLLLNSFSWTQDHFLAGHIKDGL